MLGAELGSKKVLEVVEEHLPVMKRERCGSQPLRFQNTGREGGQSPEM